MIYKNEAVFDRIQDDKWLHLASHISTILFYSDWLQILRDSYHELLNIHKLPIHSQCNDGYPGSCGKFR